MIYDMICDIHVDTTSALLQSAHFALPRASKPRAEPHSSNYRGTSHPSSILSASWGPNWMFRV